MLKDKMILLGILLLLISTFATNSSYKIIQDDTNDFLLPDIVTPFNYKLNIAFSKDNLDSKNDTFGGNVEISFYVKKETTTIKLHAPSNKIKIEIGTIAVKDQKFNETTSVLTLNLSEKLAPLTKYVLKANYAADINTKYMRGAYRSSYKNRTGNDEYLIATQFEPTSAREVFPCFDEPKYKATFDISITHPYGTQTLSNAEMDTTLPSAKDTVVTTFKETKKMSTYLVGFIVTKFTFDTVKESGVTYKVWSRDELKGYRKFALEWSKKILLALEAFTGINYATSNTKLDQIALPDSQPAGMENWGLVTYKEKSLLFNGKESSNFTQQSILETMAHELSHQWFGDLVTCHWWDDAFLNEGFATYFQHYLLGDIINELSPWEMDNQFVVDKLQPVLVDDALKNDALTRKVIQPEDIRSKFDSISYNKGASIIRMIANVMGESAFKAGLRKYLKTKSYSNASPSDLFNSLENEKVNLPQKIGVLMEGWFNNPGYPIITATQQDEDLVLSQKQFSYNNDDKAKHAKWYIPISYTLQSDDAKFSSPAPRVWVDPKKDLVIKGAFSGKSANDWVIINSLVSGYYRVNYNGTLWQRIEKQLRENHKEINRLNRAQIVDDIFNLARSDNGLQYSQVFSYLDYLKNETCYYPWTAALASLNFLITRVANQKPLETALHQKSLELMSGVYNSLSLNSSKSDTQITLLKRKLIFSNACKFGAENCTKQVKSLYDAFKATSQPIDRNLRNVVYCYGLRQSQDDKDWEFMWKLYKETESPSEQIEILEALGCTLNDKQLNNYLDLSLKISEIHKQDLPTVWKAVYSNSQEGAKVALNYLIANHAAIKDYYPNAENLLVGMASHVIDNDGIQKLKDFVAKADVDESYKKAGSLAIKTATENVNWIQKRRTDLESYLQLTSGSTITTTFSCLMLITVTLFNYMTV
ncbi:unnamed protein product [Phyllotreta striolata]|uniref:Aminopeptidase n=1 Tax=Phyllotreta striolata TaxID=444603 RepID=A0A9P0DQE6_PHYSR|nr:unnamed protein product [Phyllotreta striolata]